MKKRTILFDTYDTAVHGWTLTGWKLSPAVQKTAYIDKPSGDGTWDLSTVLSNGQPRYKDRSLTATFECSEGTRQEREAKIRHMVNLLDGMKETIILPDDDFHFITGRIHIEREYNDLVHAAVTVTAVCEPWKYATAETILTLTAFSEERSARLINDGRRAVVPTIKVEGNAASVLLAYGTSTKAFSAGTYQWPDLFLTPGSHAMTYSGTGTVTITYREAVLE